MNLQWPDYIEERPGLMDGKPTMKGTRLTVDFVLRQLACGMTQEEMLHQYPTLTKEHLAATLLFAADAVTMDQRTDQ